jgi:hypothetical protein
MSRRRGGSAAACPARLAQQIAIGIRHHRDDRVAAGDRTVRAEDDGMPVRGTWIAPGQHALARQLRSIGALERWSVQTDAHPVGLVDTVQTSANKGVSVANRSARGPGATVISSWAAGGVHGRRSTAGTAPTTSPPTASTSPAASGAGPRPARVSVALEPSSDRAATPPRTAR